MSEEAGFKVVDEVHDKKKPVGCVVDLATRTVTYSNVPLPEPVEISPTRVVSLEKLVIILKQKGIITDQDDIYSEV
ncbi:hypothetical protein [Huginn virus]|nr:hypothetical protein [Huginn virus]